MSRTRVRWGRVLALLVAVLICAGLSMGLANAASAGSSPGHLSQRVYRVHAGDTLWSIAVRFGGRQADPRPLVDGIVDANHLAGPIQPGQQLVVPVP